MTAGQSTAQRFAMAPLDRPTRMITATSVLFLAFLLPIVTLGDESAAPLVAVLGAAILLLAYGFSPGSLEVDGDALRIRRRLFGAREMRLTGPSGPAPWTFGVGGVRLGGSGGLFGWYGAFHRPGHGRYRAYLTDRSRIVACTTDAGLVVVSPADRDAFLRATSGAAS